MELSHEQASSALQDIATAQRRLGIYTGYHHAAPHFWLWGAIWIVGYAVTDFWPQRAGWAWLALDLLGVTCGTLIARGQQRDGASAAERPRWAGQVLRILGASAAIVLFIFGSYYLLQPSTTEQYGIFPVLLMGFLYTLVGLWAGSRWLVTGLVLAALSLLGFRHLGQHSLATIGACGGLTLLLTGFWMRGR